MLVSDIMTRVKRTFGDESGVQLQDDDLLRYINDAQREIVKENENLLEQTALATSVIGQSDYSLPVDLLIFRSLSYRGPGDIAYYPLKGYTLNQFNEYIQGWDQNTSQNGTPVCYMIYSGKVSLFPPPDHNLANTMKIYYNRKPIPVTVVGDTPELPEVYHDTIIRICLAYAYEMDEDWDAVAAKGAQVAGDIRTLKGKEDWKNEDVYPTITVREEDM